VGHVVFQLGGFLNAVQAVNEADRRRLVLRALETVEEIGTHLHLTEILVRTLAQLDVDEEKRKE
jgi:hypothetical protein